MWKENIEEFKIEICHKNTIKSWENIKKSIMKQRKYYYKTNLIFLLKLWGMSKSMLKFMILRLKRVNHTNLSIQLVYN